MELSINTPAILFPAISLVLLAQTNRFLALAAVVRNLHEKWMKNPDSQQALKDQIKSLRSRLRLVRNMQLFGVFSFLMSIFSIGAVAANMQYLAILFFGISITCFAISLVISLIELMQSTAALELELSDIGDLRNDQSDSEK
jgi:hypothetical protein